MYMTPFEKFQHDENQRRAATQPKATPLPHTPKVPWSSQVIDRSRGSANRLPISDTVSWYQTEDQKRRHGEKNDLDIADIRAAAKGVKNRWTDRMKKNPEKFKAVIEDKSFDWAVINAEEASI